jgi:hypothetical protein
MINPLAVLMANDDPYIQSGAKQAIFDIVAKASDPGSPAETRKEVSVELKESQKTSGSEIVSSYLRWLVGMIE